MATPDERELSYLSDKPANLNAPGITLNTLYYAPANSIVEAVESRFVFGRYNQSLTSQQMGASGQVTINNESFLGTTMLFLELVNVPINVYLSRGWGYAFIDNIQFNFGSSNVQTISYTGDTLWQMICAQCPTAEKRNEFLRVGGEALLGGGIARTYATVQLEFPWSSAYHDKIPFDTNLLNQPLVIIVNFKPAVSVFGGSGVYPTQFNSAKVFCRQGDLTNKDVSVKLKLYNSPGTFIGYPYVYPQTQTPVTFSGSPDTSTPTSVQIQSFINSDLLAITFYAVRSSRRAPGGSNTPNPFCCDNLTDIVVNLNGIPIFRLDGDSHKLTSADQLAGAGYYSALEVQAGTVGLRTATPLDCYPITLDFARLKPYTYHEYYQNTPRIPQQPMTLQFITETNETYQLFATYYYNALNQVSAGTSNISY